MTTKSCFMCRSINCAMIYFHLKHFVLLDQSKVHPILSKKLAIPYHWIVYAFEQNVLLFCSPNNKKRNEKSIMQPRFNASEII